MTRRALVLDEVALFEYCGRRVDDVGTLLYETGIVILVSRSDAAQSQGLEHPNIASKINASAHEHRQRKEDKAYDAQIGVSEPLYRLVPTPNCAQHNLCIEFICELRNKLQLDWELLVQETEIVLQFHVVRDDHTLAMRIGLRTCARFNQVASCGTGRAVCPLHHRGRVGDRNPCILCQW